jgi:L-threonylcarbamoyladenylate synthase
MDKSIVEKLIKEEVGITPTDTLYGLVGRAFSEIAVKKIYKLKKRSPKKPFIILIASLKDLDLFGISADNNLKKILKSFWPGKVSVILPCEKAKLSYLHLGTKTLAFRMPDKKDLLELIRKTGPLVAPSANPEGKHPALTIKEAKKYFGDNIDFYKDGGKLDSLPSTLIKIENGKVILLRKGAVKII